MASGFWSGRSVFITGASGFLGSWLARNLEKEHARVVPCEGRVENYDFLADVLGRHSIDTVFHLAAQSIVAGGQENPRSTFETNVRGTWNILEACRQSNSIERVLVASSSHAYGQHTALPLLESYPLQSTYPYDVSKSAADMIARSYHTTYNLPVVVVRSGAFYGEGDMNFSRVVPGTIRRIMQGERPMVRGAGTSRRDLLYIQDVVDAYLLLGEHAADENVTGQVFNVGSEDPVSARDVVEKILKLMNSSLEPHFIKDSLKEVGDMYVSSEKIQKKIGWKQKVSLENGLKKTIRWYEEHKDIADIA